MSILAQSNWKDFISQCQAFYVQNGYQTPQSIMELSHERNENMMTNALKAYISAFPISIKLDLMCYHKEFVKECMFKALKQG